MMKSLDGYFEGLDHNLFWHHVDEEFNDFAAAQMREVDTGTTDISADGILLAK